MYILLLRLVKNFIWVRIANLYPFVFASSNIFALFLFILVYPTDSCPEILTVTFIKGSEPISYCTVHQKYFEIPKTEEYPEIKKPYYEAIEEIKEKYEEKPTETEEKIEEKIEEKKETLQSLIEKLREKYKEQDK